MLNYNLHNHTYRCKHATGSEEDMLKQAIKDGYEVFGLSDHMAYNTTSTRYRMEYSEKYEYISIIKKLKDDYSSSIMLYRGFEAEYQESVHDELVDLFVKDEVDYLALGQHYKDIDKPETYNGLNNTDSHVADYVDQCIAAFKTGLFYFIAHPDLFMNNVDKFTEECTKHSIRLIEAAMKYNVLLEYNAGGVRSRRYKDIESYPRREFWLLVKQYGAKVIVNSDAHSPSEISDIYYQTAVEEAKELNIDIIENIDLTEYHRNIKENINS